jgi:hypothetical protein
VNERPARRGRCPECAAAVDDDQEYCLECGARLPSPWGPRPAPPPWVWIVIGALALVALVSGVIVAVLATHDENPVTAVVGPPAPPAPAPATLPATSTSEPPAAPPPLPPPDTITLGEPTTDTAIPTVSTLGPDTTLTDTGLTDTGLTDTGFTDTGFTDTGFTDTGGTQTDASGLVVWPSGTPAYTVVVASLPEARGEAAAREQAQAAADAGLADVGVLASSDYSSLRGGFWVVFAGVYPTLGEATAALDATRASGFPDAYVREVA